jgi:hypothetical protein
MIERAVRRPIPRVMRGGGGPDHDDTSTPLLYILREYHRMYPQVRDAITRHVVETAPESFMDFIAKPLSLACVKGGARGFLPSTCVAIEFTAVRAHCRWSMEEFLTTAHEAYRRVKSDGFDGLLLRCEANRFAVAGRQDHGARPSCARDGGTYLVPPSALTKPFLFRTLDLTGRPFQIRVVGQLLPPGRRGCACYRAGAGGRASRWAIKAVTEGKHA